jgi:localization factor PodJL
MAEGKPALDRGLDPRAHEVAAEDAFSHDDLIAPAGARYLETPSVSHSASARPEDMSLALERLSSRIEAAEQHSALAIASVERTVRDALARLQAAERDQVSTADRLNRIEAAAHGPRSVEALRALEAALGKVVSKLADGDGRTRETIAGVTARVEEAEAKTTTALKTLQTTFAALDERLRSVEVAGPAPEGYSARLEALAAALSERVDAARAEMAQRMTITADTRFDRMERALSEMTEHVRDAEQRSAQAIEQLGGEVGRIAAAVETKFARADSVQALALEKLGAEITRITERLADRISHSERRSAMANDDVGEQVARITERISQRHERTASELAARIEKSEERTQRLLDEARAKLEALAEGQTPADTTIDEVDAADDDDGSGGSYPRRRRPGARAYSHAFQADRPASLGYDATSITPFRARAEATAIAPAGLDAAVGATDGALALDIARHDLAETIPLEAPAATIEAADEIVETPIDLVAEAPEDEEIAAPDALAIEPVAAAPAAEDDFDDVFAIEAEETAGTLSQADDDDDVFAFDVETPAAAHADVDDDDDATSDDVWASAPPAYDPPVSRAAQDSRATRQTIERLRLAAREAAGEAGARRQRDVRSDVLFPPRQRPAKRTAGVATAAVMAAGMGGAVAMAVTGFTLAQNEHPDQLSKRFADALSVARHTVGEVRAAEADTTPKAAVARAAMATDFKRITPPAATPAQDLVAAYSEAVGKITVGDKTGLNEVKRLANLGYAPAQYFLAKLYDSGLGGVAKDAVEARRWTERAAENGERKAMHNLALGYFEGTGGPKNTTLAAQWFRRAADLGLVDSQYNLGRLYEDGMGVTRNPAEAYKWYLIAGAEGDTESKTSAGRVKGLLSAEARAAAERSALAFRSGAAAPAPAPAPQPTGDLVTAQRGLSALGYYQGPADGVSSPALRLALTAFQRDQGLPATGAADPATVSKLGAYQR